MSAHFVKLDDQDVDQPPPRPEGIVVTDALVSWLSECSVHGAHELADLVVRRAKFGLKKYGQPLMSRDGRNSALDAEEELGDLVQYVFKAKLNGESIESIRRMLPVLCALVENHLI